MFQVTNHVNYRGKKSGILFKIFFQLFARDIHVYVHAQSPSHHCLNLYDLKDCSPPGSSLHGLWDFPGKDTRVVCHFLLQGIFPTQGSNLHLLLGRWILYHSATWEAQKCSCFVLKCAAENRNLKAGNHFKNHQTMLYITYKIITELQMDEMIHLSSSAFLVTELNLKSRSSNSKLFLFFK